MTRSGRSIGTTILVLSLALSLSGCVKSEAKNDPPGVDAAKPAIVTVTPAAARVVARTLEVPGAVIADAQTEVAAEVAARVIAAPIERGTPVRTGDVLARLDQQEPASQLREAEAMEAQTAARLGLVAGQAFDATRTPEVRQAQATMERAEAEHRRFAKLAADGLVSRSDYDLKRMEWLNAREQVDASLNQVRQLAQTLEAQRARVALARKALADTLIRAPLDGVVAERHVNVGQYLSRGARVATIVRIDPVRIELTIPEAVVAEVRRGQKVSFTVQSYPGRRFEGTIAHVGPALKSDARALVAEAVVPNGDGELQPGFFASARIALPASRPSVVVPASAVRTEAGVSRVYVARNGRAEVRLVQIGTEDEGRSEILRGVAAGEQVITSPADHLADGLPIQVETGPSARPLPAGRR
jgi:membrane fusion protein, multidrug efflux system